MTKQEEGQLKKLIVDEVGLARVTWLLSRRLADIVPHCPVTLVL